MPGTTMTPAVIEAPGVIRHVGKNRPITIGEWHGNDSARVRRFAEWCEKAGLEVAVSENILENIWSKFVGMTTFSALTCLTRLPVRTVTSTAETCQLANDAMDEIIAVARARGIVLADDLKSKIFASTEKFDSDWKTSMCNDLEAGKPIEVDSLSGAVHRLGLELGVPTPVHSVAYRALIPHARK
jgi:2-dehydropantoate 2-reductase